MNTGKRILAMLLTVLLVVTACPITDLPIAAEEEDPLLINITEQAKAYAGTATQPTTKPVDDSLSSYQDISWKVSGEVNPNCYIKLDFGSPVYFSRIEVANYNQNSYYQWEAYGSNDGSEWTLLCEKKDEAKSRVDGVHMTYGYTFPEVCYRYVKIQGTYHSANIGYHFNEIDIYSEHPNVAFGRPITAGNGGNAAAVVDGITTALFDLGYWGETAKDPDSAYGLEGNCYVQIDLQNSYEVQRIDVWTYTGRDYRYALYGSDDAEAPISEWTLLCEKTDSEKMTAEGRSYELTASFRYLRAYGLYNSANVGFHFNEIKVFATPLELTELRISPWLSGMENWQGGSMGLTTQILMEISPFQIKGVNYTGSDFFAEDFPYRTQFVVNGGYYANDVFDIQPSSHYADYLRFEPCVAETPFVPVKGETYSVTLNLLDGEGSVVASGSNTWTCPMSPVCLYDEGQTYTPVVDNTKYWYNAGEYKWDTAVILPQRLPQRYFLTPSTDQFDLSYRFDLVMNDTVIYRDIEIIQNYDWTGGKYTDDIMGAIKVAMEGVSLAEGETYGFRINAYQKSYPSGEYKLEGSFGLRDFTPDPAATYKNQEDPAACAALFWSYFPHHYSFDAIGGMISVDYDPDTQVYTLTADQPDGENVFYGWYLDGALLADEKDPVYRFTAEEGATHMVSLEYVEPSSVDSYTVTFEAEYPDGSVKTLYAVEMPEGSVVTYDRSYQDDYTDGYMIYSVVLPEMGVVRADVTYRITFAGTDTRAMTLGRWANGIENWGNPQKTQFLLRLYDYTGAELNLFDLQGMLRLVVTVDGVEYDDAVIGSYGGYAINRFTLCENELFVPSCVAGTAYTISLKAYDLVTGDLAYYTVNSYEFIVPENFVPIHAHAYEEEVLVEPGCEADGSSRYTCPACGHSYVEEIPASGVHQWDEGTVTVEPTCGADGEIVYTCLVCGKTETEVLPASGVHRWDEGTVTVAPTCVQDGELTYICQDCGEVYVDPIPANGEHSWDEGVCTAEPSCTENGELLYTCLGCGETRTEEIPAVGHSYEEIERIPASCSAEGSLTMRCAACGDTYVETLPKESHSYGDPGFVWQTLDGVPVSCVARFCCENCGELTEADCTVETEQQEESTVYTATVSFGGKQYTTTWQPPIPEIPGDLTGDGVINIEDVAVLLASISNGEADPDEKMDLNGDGAVSIKDVTALLLLLSE